MGVKRLHKRKKKPLTPIFVVTILGLTLAGIGGFVAKYRSEMQYEAEMIAANFHISSDMLEEPDKNATHQVGDWKEGFQIELYNYEKENVALVASEEIAYTVTLSSNQFKYSIDSQEPFPGGKQSTVHTLTIEPINSSENITDNLTVTVETLSPFKKQLSATFQLIGTQQPKLEWTPVTNNGNYYLAVITTGQYSGNITLDWTDGLQPDNTNKVMENWGSTPSTNSFEAEAFTTYELIFFNPDKIENAQMTLSAVN